MAIDSSSAASTILRRWVPLAFVATILAGSVYIAVQQNYRQNANDPQVQVAEDVAARLSAGESPSSIVPNRAVDIDKSLSTFVIIYDKNGHLVASSAQLNGRTPTIPAGVLASARTHADDRVTWEPAKGVRIASVTKYYNGNGGGYVLSGRNMREVEKREDKLMMLVAAAWLVAVGGSLMIIAIF